MNLDKMIEIIEKSNISKKTWYDMARKELKNIVKSSEINDNALLFWGFINAYGFNPNNYSNNLELIQSVPNSVSQYLKDYKHFLLSEKVRYEDLETYGIKGACGYIDKNEGIIVPRSIEADEYFRNHQGKVPSKQIPRYTYPAITDFDSIVSYYDWTSITRVEQLDQITKSVYFSFNDRYLGFITNKNDKNLLEKESVISKILEVINNGWPKEQYQLVHDTVSNKNKELYLIKKK